MPRFSLRRPRRDKRNTSISSASTPLTIPPTSPSSPPPTLGRTSRFHESSSDDDDYTAPTLQAETARLIHKHHTTLTLIDQVRHAAHERLGPLSLQTNILRVFNAHLPTHVPANWTLFLASPPPVSGDLAAFIHAGESGRSPGMREYLDALGRELEVSVDPRFSGIEHVAEMRGELSRARRMALDELQSANLSWERQVEAHRRERVKAIEWLEREVVVYREVNRELLEAKRMERREEPGSRKEELVRLNERLGRLNEELARMTEEIAMREEEEMRDKTDEWLARMKENPFDSKVELSELKKNSLNKENSLDKKDSLDKKENSLEKESPFNTKEAPLNPKEEPWAEKDGSIEVQALMSPEDILSQLNQKEELLVEEDGDTEQASFLTQEAVEAFQMFDSGPN